MFDFETEEVIEALNRTIREAVRIEDFFITKGGLYMKGTDHSKLHLRSAFSATQIASILRPDDILETIWLIPKTRWIGGYDELKLFSQLLRKFEEADVESVEIFFVTPSDNTGLVISLETDRGSLSQLKKESIQILYVEEFSTSDAGYAKYSQQSL